MNEIIQGKYKGKYSLGVLAQDYARKELIKRHRKEYDELYRAEMLRLGGTPRPSKEDKVRALEAELVRLKGELGEAI